MMSTHFDEAFIVSDNAPSLFVDNDFSADGLFDFAAASHGVEVSDTPSDDEDGLYDESVLHVPQLVDDEEVGDDEDASTAEDGDFSWRIDHATGDHKLKGMFDSIALMSFHP
jgi:hypothetical protein